MTVAERRDMKNTIASNARDPENRSKKYCVCGGHSSKAKNSDKEKPLKKWRRKLKKWERKMVKDVK